MFGLSMMVAAAAATAPVPAASPLVNLRTPEAVATALQTAGYKAEIKTSEKTGKRYISSAANGSNFSVNFYDCADEKGCASIQFSSWYKKEPVFTLAMVNEWNNNNRFLKVYIDSDGDLDQQVDMSTVGAVTQENFADVLDWYTVMDSRLAKFIDARREAAKPATDKQPKTGTPAL